MQDGYVCDVSELGKVYYRPQGIEIEGQIEINYMEYPWISCFEVDGMTISKK